MGKWPLIWFIWGVSMMAGAQAHPGNRTVSGIVTNARGEAVVSARVTATAAGQVRFTETNGEGRFNLSLPLGPVRLRVEGKDLIPQERAVGEAEKSQDMVIPVRYRIGVVHETLVITASTVDPAIDRRNDAVYKNTLFNRDDQIFDTLASGINAGQHEGGGKSVEIRRFGFNLDHGGVNGGLKVLVDDVQQNQSTQGHGQGYLGYLKSLTPELVDDVDILNGPFSAEYGDFSGLGVVHIRLKERLHDRFTARFQGGSFGSFRTFLAWSPQLQTSESFAAYEGSRTDGPFLNPLHYKRDNLTTNFTHHFSGTQILGFRSNAGRNDFDSSGQIPLDQVWAGLLDRFGYVDPDDGGVTRNATASAYYKNDFASNDVLRADGFVTRSLFDLYSNFTFFLNDPVHGDEFQQHDSRLMEGANLQWLHPWKLFGRAALLTAGSNLHASQIDVGLLHTEARRVLETWTRADAHITNAAVYAQNALDFQRPRVHVDVGLRYDNFRWSVKDLVGTTANGSQSDGKLQPKISVNWMPAPRVPLTLHVNYGRGINSEDARGVVERPQSPRIATTDFTQLGTSTEWRRFSLSTDMFLIDHSNEQVYVPDDGSFEFKGPSRAYGWEAKSSVQITRAVSWNAGLTQVSNSFYKGTHPREYVDSAPHTVANSGLTIDGWRGFYGSVRYRHISHYILDPLDRTAEASGLDVVDIATTRTIRHGVELNFAVDNLTDHHYYETQNWFDSRLTPCSPAVATIHATPGYPIGLTVGMTFRME